MKKIRVRWKTASVDEFLVRHGDILTAEHVFLLSDDPPPMGMHVRFELLLADGTAFLVGTATVIHDERGGRPGMVLLFDEVEPEYSWLIAKLEQRAAAADEVQSGEVDLGLNDVLADDPYSEEEDTQPEARPAGLVGARKRTV